MEIKLLRDAVGTKLIKSLEPQFFNLAQADQLKLLRLMLIDDPAAASTFGTIAEYAKEYLPYILQFVKEAWNAWRSPSEETKTVNPMNMNNNN